MIATIPALWFNGILPLTPTVFGSMPVVMLVLLGLLCAAVVLLAMHGGRDARRTADRARRRRLRVVAPTGRGARRVAIGWAP